MATETPTTVRVDVRGLGDGDVKHFRFTRDGESLGGFVVGHEGALRAYVNRCPHVTYSLDLGDGNVQDPTRKFLQCFSHGAMFLPESGECFMGPVVGRRLEPLPSARQDDALVVTITP
ncbi:MAG: Rieske 2Fe-2S domain-containing protein, partial [Myxococcota bacterium]|nr:Rieske 2Fe-2S domain-containing protein [Myxococcota bacterium]